MTVRKMHAIPSDAVVCLFLGRMNADKGVQDLLAAYASIAGAYPKLWLLLVGPDEEAMLPGLLSRLPDGIADRVVVEGYTETPERYLSAADFLCLPSYRDGFVVVVIEAAAAGLPAIGSRIYGVRDALVDEVTGLFFHPGDVPALSAAIERLAGDPELRHRMGGAGRLRIQREFTQEAVVANYVGFFKGLFDGEVF